MEYRCPKHDVIFDSETSNKKPGADKSHPVGGHPDCPKCQREANPQTITRAEVEVAAKSNGVTFDLAAQQAVAQGYDLVEE